MISWKLEITENETRLVIKCTGENPVACLWDEAKI